MVKRTAELQEPQPCSYSRQKEVKEMWQHLLHLSHKKAKSLLSCLSRFPTIPHRSEKKKKTEEVSVWLCQIYGGGGKGGLRQRPVWGQANLMPATHAKGIIPYRKETKGVRPSRVLI